MIDFIRYNIGRLLVRVLRLRGFSYSSLNEDNIIDWLTGYKKSGIYIDVGANNPDIINNTRLFYERGWRGINIEPSEKDFKLLQEKRPEDKNYNNAIGLGEIILFEGEDNSVGNTYNQKLADERGLTKTRKIKLKPLSEIFEENNLKTVDFISVDVETFEHEVLKSNNWEKYKATVLCIEGSGYDYLKKFGYKKVFWDGCNTYYKLKQN